MKKLNVRRSLNLPSKTELIEFERINNIIIPREYKSFLLEYNIIDSFENISVRTIPNADNGYTSTEQCERWEMIFEEFPHSLEGITEDQNDGLLFV